jgi:hypothetical protein
LLDFFRYCILSFHVFILDKSRSPVAYQAFDKITVTRTVSIGSKNKYLINGTAAQVQQVQTLFQSVQLNVNNPHWMVMQGSFFFHLFFCYLFEILLCSFILVISKRYLSFLFLF